MLPKNDKQLFNEFIDDVDAYVRERFGYRAKCAQGRPPTVHISRVKIQLYLRFRGGGDWPEDILVIASIGFRKQRVGHGRALLEKFVAESKRFGYTHIAVEQTHSPMMVNFVQKLGFASYGDKRNWIISVADLITKLNSVPQTTSCSRQV